MITSGVVVLARVVPRSSILILAAALTSGRSFGAVLQSLLPAFLNIGRTTEALLVASLVIFDLMQHRRVFATSVFGAALLLPIRPPWMYLTLHSELGIRWTKWLGGIPT